MIYLLIVLIVFPSLITLIVFGVRQAFSMVAITAFWLGCALLVYLFFAAIVGALMFGWPGVIWLLVIGSIFARHIYLKNKGVNCER